MKICRRCKDTKPLSEFNNKSRSPDGKNYYCKECSRALSKKHYVENTDRVRASNERWRSENLEADLARKRERYRETRAVSIARVTRWQAENPELARLYKRRWKKRNPGKLAEYKHRRRSLESLENWTDEEWQAMLMLYGGQCLSCGATERITRDHVIPLSKGGANTIDNLQPLCVECNCKKGTKTIDYRNQ
jgi:5-methylcytosine-specific restriction endonuclease McrA